MCVCVCECVSESIVRLVRLRGSQIDLVQLNSNLPFGIKPRPTTGTTGCLPDLESPRTRRGSTGEREGIHVDMYLSRGADKLTWGTQVDLLLIFPTFLLYDSLHLLPQNK